MCCFIIEDLLQGLFEIGLVLFKVRTVTYKFLSHCCPLLSGDLRFWRTIFA